MHKPELRLRLMINYPEAVLKKFIEVLSFLLLILTVLPVNAAEPENFIPAASPVVMRFAANRAINLPWLKELAKNNKAVKKFNTDLDKLKAQYNITPQEVFSGDVWAAQTGKNAQTGNDFACYMKTALTQERFDGFVRQNASDSKDFTCKNAVIANTQVYIIEPVSKEEHKTVVAYLADDVICFMPLTEKSGTVLAESQKGIKNPLVDQIDRKTLFALSGDARKMDIPAKKSKLRTLKATADLTGAAQRDLQIKADLKCKNASTAMQLSMQMQFMYPGLVGMLFGKDQKLMESLIDALQVSVDKETVAVQFDLDAAQQQKIAVYMSNPANRPQINNNAVGPQVKNK